MKVAKIRKIEDKKDKIEIKEPEITLKNFIMTILTILVVLSVFYIITTFVIKPIISAPSKEPAEFDSTKITMGQLLTRPEEDYYVLAVKESEYLNLYTVFNYFELYNNYIKRYSEKEDSYPFYWIDMDEAFNRAYWSDELDIDNHIINDDVLFKVYNGVVTRYYVGHDAILEELQGM